MPKEKRAVKGDGTIYYDPSRKKWRAEIPIGRNTKGRLLRKSFSGDTRPEVAAKKKEYELKLQGKGQKKTTGQNTRFYEYSDRWLKHKKARVKANTYKAYEDICKHFKPFFGRKQMEDITVRDLNNYFFRKLQPTTLPDGTTKAGLASGSLKKHKALLHSIFKKAVQEAVIPHNIVEDVDVIASTPKPLTTLSEEDVKRLLEHTKAYDQKLREWDRHSNMYLICLIAIATGARRGEILALRKDHITFQENDKGILESAQVFFKDNLVEVNGECSITTPKTEHGIRLVTLDDFTAGVLKEHISNLSENQEFVFHTSSGRHYQPSNISRAFREISKKLKLGISFHGLRHTHATLLLAQGVEIKVISSRLGHSDVSTTYKSYIGALPKHDQVAAQAIGKIITAT